MFLIECNLFIRYKINMFRLDEAILTHLNVKITVFWCGGENCRNKTCDITVGELTRNLVNLEWFWLQQEWLRKMKTIALCPQSIRAFVQNTLPKTASNKIFWYVVLMGPYFKLRKSVLKKDAVQLIFNFPMESCKRAIGQKATKMSK